MDLITLDLARRLPFRLRPAALAAAAARGVAFELCYAPALRDEAARRNLFGNAAGAGAAVAKCCVSQCPSRATL